MAINIAEATSGMTPQEIGIFRGPASAKPLRRLSVHRVDHHVMSFKRNSPVKFTLKSGESAAMKGSLAVHPALRWGRLVGNSLGFILHAAGDSTRTSKGRHRRGPCVCSGSRHRARSPRYAGVPPFALRILKAPRLRKVWHWRELLVHPGAEGVVALRPAEKILHQVVRRH